MSAVDESIAVIARSICKSGRFETGEGTCSLLCMEFLGSPRDKGCPNSTYIHKALAERIIADLAKVKGGAQ